MDSSLISVLLPLLNDNIFHPKKGGGGGGSAPLKPVTGRNH